MMGRLFDNNLWSVISNSCLQQKKKKEQNLCSLSSECCVWKHQREAEDTVRTNHRVQSGWPVAALNNKQIKNSLYQQYCLGVEELDETSLSWTVCKCLMMIFKGTSLDVSFEQCNFLIILISHQPVVMNNDTIQRQCTQSDVRSIEAACHVWTASLFSCIITLQGSFLQRENQIFRLLAVWIVCVELWVRRRPGSIKLDLIQQQPSLFKILPLHFPLPVDMSTWKWKDMICDGAQLIAVFFCLLCRVPLCKMPLFCYFFFFFFRPENHLNPEQPAEPQPKHEGEPL